MGQLLMVVLCWLLIALPTMAIILFWSVFGTNMLIGLGLLALMLHWYLVGKSQELLKDKFNAAHPNRR